jgi:hypothetical protein
MVKFRFLELSVFFFFFFDSFNTHIFYNDYLGA